MKTVEFLGKVYVVEGTVGVPDNAIHLDTLPAAKLVELCNLLISNLDLGRRIKMFQSKAKGVKRVINLLVQFDSAFDDDPEDVPGPDNVSAFDDGMPDSMLIDGEPRVGLVSPAAPVVPTTGNEPSAPLDKIREGSKQEALIALIKRPEGASIKEISDALGWVNHTARGAISRDLKKRLGLPVNKSRVEGRGGVYTIGSEV